MPLRTNHALGAAALGAIVSWFQKRQDEKNASFFGSFSAHLPAPFNKDGYLVAALPALIELVPDLWRLVPPEYREAVQGASDAGIGIIAMGMAAQQGFGKEPTTGKAPTTGKFVGYSTSVRPLATRALARTVAPVTPVSSSVLSPVRVVSDDLSDSLTASAA